MRELVYYVAVTADGFIAREDGSFDDFPWDDGFIEHLLERSPESFPAPMHDAPLERSDNKLFDAVLMGRTTYEVGLHAGLSSPYPSLDQYVVSTEMEESPDPAVTLWRDRIADRVREVKSGEGRAIWLCGGSMLASSLLMAGLVDRLTLKVNPILFGSGIPLFAEETPTRGLELLDSTTYPSGHVLLDYRVE